MTVVRIVCRGVALAAAIAAAVQGPAPPAASAQDKGQGQGAGGKYAELTAEWWQWAFSIPASENPLFDETGEFAAVGQANGIGPGNKYFFLCGVFNVSGTAERWVTVPAGKDLFFPVINSEWNYVERPDLHSVQELRAAVKSDIDSVTDQFATLSLLDEDGDVIDQVDLDLMRLASPTFAITLPEDDIFGFAQRRINPVVSDGYWVNIPAPPRGKYKLEFGAALPLSDFELNIVYYITVP